uniref:Isopenicillin N synthase-like Fe(2+) 2OG dioxygenase domain-containing protein n=1 Tax=Solanum lycopersicum TaxID=4081 RepID=A0A3Q7EES6_SOLLC
MAPPTMEGFKIVNSQLDHAKELWPHDNQNFLKVLSFQLCMFILNYLKPSLEHSINSFKFEGALQLNSYPCCPNPNHALRLAPHTDSLFLTILHQINNTKGNLLYILSNGEFPSVYHRVLVDKTKYRVSLAFFLFRTSSLLYDCSISFF